ncbi:MAG: type II toxin-antitoxin system death-on-curing family toxin [Verrucomicrobiota bacterium]|jgi:death-on-curing protein
MKEPAWITREECLAIHEMMLAQHGGLAGLRDEDLLESALAKPRNLFGYAKAGLVEMAASYAAGIIRNHPFLDGNKRTGFLVAAVFLEVNGYMLSASEESVVESTLSMAAGKLKESEYAAWLKVNSQKS